MMLESQKNFKAGKIAFLLVCLFLCSACGREKAVFVAGENSHLEEVKSKKEVTSEEDRAEQEVSTGTTEVTEQAEENSREGMININTADAETLMTLPGIGASRAAAIIEYRQKTGTFGKIEDIMNVKGIGSGIFNKISSLICVK